MRRLQICLSLFLITTCLGQLGNVDLKPLPGMQFVNRTHRFGRGIVAYWPMNERSGTTAFDLSGNGLTGTLVNDVSWVPGKFGFALDFDGTGDYVEVPHNVILTPSSSHITVMSWAKCTTWSGSYNVLVEKADNFSPYAGYVLRNQSSEFEFVVVIEGLPRSATWTGTLPTENTWFQAVGTYDGLNVKLYIDGIERASNAIVGGMSLGTSVLRIGEGTAATGRAWLGPISQMMIYNRALSASEIALHYKEKDSWMFKRGDIELMAKSVAAPPAGGQVIMISSIPLIFIIGFCFIIGRKNE